MVSDLLECYGPCSEDDIILIENDLPAKLPENYRRWLKEHGGGWLAEDLVMPDEYGNGIIRNILSPRDVWANYPGDGYSRFIPLDFVMVASGSGGGVCIRLASKGYASVWYADFDMADMILDEDERSMEIMMRLADSWETFLASR